MADQISNRSWRGASGLGHRHLVVEDTEPEDRQALLSIYREGDGPGVLLNPTQLREVAADLLRRADLMQGVPDLSAIPLAPIMRPNGKVYKPQRIAVEQWEDEWEGRYGAVILGTHDTEAARVLADHVVKWWDNEYIATKPDVDWFRLTYSGSRGEMAWQRDEAHGRAGVMFAADYPAATA